MKITKKYLQQVIKEELEKALNEEESYEYRNWQKIKQLKFGDLVRVTMPSRDHAEVLILDNDGTSMHPDALWTYHGESNFNDFNIYDSAEKRDARYLEKLDNTKIKERLSVKAKEGNEKAAAIIQSLDEQ